MVSRSRDAFRPRLASISPPERERAQGRPGARCTRGLVCHLRTRRRTRAYRSSGGIRPSLRNGFTAYFVLFPVNGSFATVAPRTDPWNLAPAPRRQNHTTSPYASASLVSHGFRVHHIPPRVSWRSRAAPLVGWDGTGMNWFAWEQKGNILAPDTGPTPSVICPAGNTRIGRSWTAAGRVAWTRPPTEAALRSNANRWSRRSDHPYDRVGVTSAVEVDVDYPQNENSNKCGGNGFHKLLTMRIRQVFRAYPPLPEVRQHQRSGVGRLSRTSNPLRTVPERPTCVANLHSSCRALRHGP